jgi:hypothetical protein
MRTKSWIHQLSELKDQTISFGKMKPLAPDTVTCRFIAKGHVLEYMDVGPDMRLPILFFGPDEFAVRSHPVLTQFETMDDVSLEVLTYGKIIEVLRNFPNSATHYKEMRRRYKQKVADRLKMDRMKTATQRYHYARQQQDWIFSVAKHKDIAAYLGISLPEWMELKRKE